MTVFLYKLVSDLPDQYVYVLRDDDHIFLHEGEYEGTAYDAKRWAESEGFELYVATIELSPTMEELTFKKITNYR